MFYLVLVIAYKDTEEQNLLQLHYSKNIKQDHNNPILKRIMKLIIETGSLTGTHNIYQWLMDNARSSASGPFSSHNGYCCSMLVLFVREFCILCSVMHMADINCT